MLALIYTTDEPAQTFDIVTKRPWMGSRNFANRIRHYEGVLRDGMGQLMSLTERLELFVEAPHEHVPASGATTSNRVFIVHGRDEGLRDQVARVVSQLELEPVILAELSNRGRTLIEKFEQHADVAFAIVILAPEDLGYLASDEPPEEANRARQNVILELGYFIAKLGRARVAALYREGTDLPTDFLGTVYTQIDVGGAWRFQLGRELKDAGFTVDLNRLAST
jgi:predicted nucleotide-binding protein